MSTLRALKTQHQNIKKSKRKKSLTILDIIKKDLLTTYAAFQKISKSTPNGKKQWKKIKKYIQVILDQEEEYQDPAFPPNNKTLNPLKNIKSKIKFISWFRIHNFFKKGDYSLFGDYKIFSQTLPSKGFRYIIDALNTISSQPSLISRLFERRKTSKQGIYSIWLNINGKWNNIIIDDFLPIFRDTKNNSNFFLTSPHSDSKAIWYCLIEKALAKAYQGYDKLYGGLENYLVRDLTGAPYSVYNLPKIDKGKIKNVGDLTEISQVTSQIKRALKKGHLISGVPRITGTQNSKSKKYLSGLKSLSVNRKGISSSHNYALICMKEVKDSRGKNSRIVKMRNPYNEIQWKGEWSAKSKSWTYDLKKKFKVESSFKKGEFWMSVKDLMTHFQTLNFYKVSPGYIYNSLEINSLYQKYDRIVLRVKVPETGKYTFSVDQVDLRIFDNTALKYSAIKLTLGKLSHKSFKLLSHTSSSELRNSYIRKVLQEGEYYLLIEKKNSKINMKYANSDDKKYSKLKKLCVSNYGPASCGIIQVEENQDNQVVYDYLCYHGWKDYSKNKPGQKLSDFKVNFYDGSWHDLSLHLLDIPDSVIYAFKNDNDFGVELKSEIKGIKNKEILGPHGRISYSQNFLLNPNSTDIFIIRKEQEDEDLEEEEDSGNFQINSIVGKKFEGVKENPHSFFKVYEYLLNLKVPIEMAEIEKDEKLKDGVGLFNVERGCSKIQNERMKSRKDSGKISRRERYEDIVEILETARGVNNPIFDQDELSQNKSDEEYTENVMIVAQDINIKREVKKENPLDVEISPLNFMEHELSDLIQVSKEKIENIEKEKLKDLIEFYGLREFVALFEINSSTLEKIASKLKNDVRISEMMNEFLESTDYNQNSKDERDKNPNKKFQNLSSKEEEEESHSESQHQFEYMMDMKQRNVLMKQIGKMKSSMKNRLKTRQRIPSMFRYQLDTSRGGDSSMSHSNRISVDKNHQKLDFSSFSKKLLLKDQRSKTERNNSFKVTHVRDESKSERKGQKMKIKVKSRSPNHKNNMKNSSRGALLEVIKDISDERGSNERGSSSSYFGSKLNKIKKSNDRLRKNLRKSIKKKIDNIKKSSKRIKNMSKSSGKIKVQKKESDAINIDELKIPQNSSYNKNNIRYSHGEQERELTNENIKKYSGFNSHRNENTLELKSKSLKKYPQNLQELFLRHNDSQKSQSNFNNSRPELPNKSSLTQLTSPEFVRASTIQYKKHAKRDSSYHNPQDESHYSSSVKRARVYTDFLEERQNRNSVDGMNTKTRNQLYLSNQLEDATSLSHKNRSGNLMFYSNTGDNLKKILSNNLIRKTDSIGNIIYPNQNNTTRERSTSNIRQNQTSQNININNSEYYATNPNISHNRTYLTEDNLHPEINTKRTQARIRASMHRRQFSDDATPRVIMNEHGPMSSSRVYDQKNFKIEGHNRDITYQQSPQRVDIPDNNNRTVSSSLQFNENNRILYKFLEKKNSNDVNYTLKKQFQRQEPSYSQQKFSSVFGEKIKLKNSFIKSSRIQDSQQQSNEFQRPQQQQMRELVQPAQRGYVNNQPLNYQNQVYRDNIIIQEPPKNIHKSPSFTNQQMNIQPSNQDFIKKYNTVSVNNPQTPKNLQLQMNKILTPYNNNNLSSGQVGVSSIQNAGERGNQANFIMKKLNLGMNYSKTPKNTQIKDFFSNNSILQSSNLMSGREAYGTESSSRNVRLQNSGSQEPLRILGYNEARDVKKF